MSLFSRLFKGPEDGDKDPEQEALPAEGRAAERAKKPGHESVDGKGSMRPTAPSFNLQPPVLERSSQAVTATVVEVGITDAKTSASPAAARSPKATADSPPARGRSSSTTIVLGSNPSVPGSAASPQRKPASSGAQRAMPPPPPLPAAAHRASPPAAPAAQPARGAPPRSKLPSGVGLEAFKPPPDPPRTSPDDGANVDLWHKER